MKFNFQFLSFTALFLILLSCKSTATIAEINELKEMVAKNKFEFTANSANPIALANVRGLENLLPPGSNINNINLATTPNYLRISKDSIQMDLPYYGERQFGGGFGTSASGIKFKGKADNAKTSFHSKNSSCSIIYNLNNKNEHLDLDLTLFANKTSTLSVNSNHRTTIIYNGFWEAAD